MPALDSVLIGLLCTFIGSIVTSVVWSHNAFMHYSLLSERIAIIETKMDIVIQHHENNCANFRPKGIQLT
jgi:hypothetical protein